MATIFSVSKYILGQVGEMSAMKLQKLAYYSQAWHLVWEERELFQEDFQAWANGPVCQPLYEKHKGQFLIDSSLFNDVKESISEKEKENIDAILKHYGSRTAQWLSDLTHMEEPWLKARERACVADGDRCTERITKAEMHEYYSGL